MPTLTRKTTRRWKPAWERQAMIDAYVAGEKVEAIAAEFDVFKTTPGNLAVRAGYKRRRPLPQRRPQ